MLASRLAKLKRNAGEAEFRSAVDGIRRYAEQSLDIPYKITAAERGNWVHYYYCADDGSMLRFDWNEPHRHVCPVCSKEWTGTLYDEAWVTMAHYSLASGLKCMGIMYMLEGDARYAERIKAVLLDYAAYYEQYEIHGDIPYNGPGKLLAQTLDESHWIMELCHAYAYARDSFSEADRRRIEDGLFRPCALFLIDHKEQQLHNHAVLITAAISIIGFLTGDESIHLAGRDGEYGLLDQLGRGILADGFWYEGVFGYHFFAFYPVLAYCLYVERTAWDLRDHPGLRRMFDYPLRYILPDGTFAWLNDHSSKATVASYAPYYEIALDWYGDDAYRQYLRLAYGVDDEHKRVFAGYSFEPTARTSYEALLYGHNLRESGEGGTGGPSVAELIAASCTSEPSGLTKLVNARGWNAMVKHSTFGGEHDHMDRLGISFRAGGTPLFVDPGTTTYFVPAHYAWFKHTYSHNTVNLGGKDQPPRDGRLLGFCEESWGTWVESAVDWKSETYYAKGKIKLPPEMCPWDEEAYRGAEIRRVTALTGELLLDVVRVTVPEEREVNWNVHVSGELDGSADWAETGETLSALSQELFREKRVRRMAPGMRLVWRIGDATLEQAGWCSREAKLYTARTPGNPPNTFRQSLIAQARTAGEVVFVNAFAFAEPGAAAQGLELNVSGAMESGYALDIRIASGVQRFRVAWRDGIGELERLG